MNELQTPILHIELNNTKPVSVNEMYAYGRRRIRKSNKYLTYSDQVVQQVKSNISNQKLKEFKEFLLTYYKRAIYIEYVFSIPQRSYFRADTSNYIKAIEDILKEIIGIDDSRNVKFLADKILSRDNKWHIQIIMKIYELEYEIPKDKWANSILGSHPSIKRTTNKKKKKTGTKKPALTITDSFSDNKISQIFLF